MRISGLYCLKFTPIFSAIRFDRAVRLFGEDDTSIQPDEFFGMFDSFLTALHEARTDNENGKKRREEEEKRAKQEAEVRSILTHFLRVLFPQVYFMASS